MTGSEAKAKGFADELMDMEVVASIGADKKTAIFNGVNVSLERVANKTALISMLSHAKPGASDAAPVATTQSTPAAHVPEKINNSGKEHEEIMTLDELKSKYPDIYKAAFDEGAAQGGADGKTQGVTAERERIKEIDAMALPGMETLTNKAKFETGISAGEYAVEIVKAQKQKGVQFLNDAQEDAAESGDIPPANPPQGTDEQEEKALLAYAAERAKTIR
jgi:hypothetical protein